MKITKLIISVRKDLGIIFIISLLIIFSIEFFLIKIPEIFNGGYKLGQIIYKLCMSYISAFIFYFLVVHLKQQKDKENLYSYIAQKVYIIISCAESLILELAKSSKIVLVNQYPSDAELAIICKSINPNDKAPLLLGGIGNYANWVQYFDYQRNRSSDYTKKVLEKMPYLETELIIILDSIEDCTHFMETKFLIKKMTLYNQDLIFFESSLSEYFNLVKKLEEYAGKKLYKYR